MKLEDQVCSLELSKRLKELGLKQRSSFYWIHPTFMPDDKEFVLENKDNYFCVEPDDCAAFTVAELHEMMDMVIGGRNKDSKEWWCHDQKANTEADAAAKSLIFQIENKLVKP